jgi:hypothetical protein
MDLRAYKCCFEYLKRSERYKECCLLGGAGEMAGLYADFGDVHAAGLLWEDWWMTHEELFSGIEPLFVLNEIQSNAEFNYLWEEGQDDLLALVINLYAPKETILNAVAETVAKLQLQLRRRENEQILAANPQAKVAERFGRPKFDPSFYHRYGLTPVPSRTELDVLERMLEVYDLCLNDGRKPPSNKLEWFEIADYLGIMVEQTARTRKDSGAMSEEEERTERAEKTKRYFREAQNVIRSAEQGSFPKHG